MDFAFGLQPLLTSYQQYRNRADPKVCCDYGLHVAIPYLYPQIEQDMNTLVKEKGRNILMHKTIKYFEKICLRECNIREADD